MLPDDELSSLRSRFARFANETRTRSPLYTHLSLAIAQDSAVASVLAAASPRQRRPNLLFATVHDLILGGANHTLAAYYPSVGGDRPTDEQTMPAFRAFLADFRDEIVERISSRATQTNEPGRCAALRPALAWIGSHLDLPVALIELGSSAGLLLHLDRYHYRFGGVEGRVHSDGVTIGSELYGPAPTALELPPIAARVGIDRHPLSPRDPGDARWLKACVWPEDVDRFARLDAALAVAAEHEDVENVEGDLTTELAPTVRRMHDNVVVCVLHSAALAYLDEDDRASIESQLAELGGERDLVRICLEGPFVEPFATLERQHPDPGPEHQCFVLGVTTWTDGQRRDRLLARVQPHGAWLQWLARGAAHSAASSRRCETSHPGC